MMARVMQTGDYDSTERQRGSTVYIYRNVGETRLKIGESRPYWVWCVMMKTFRGVFVAVVEK